MALACALFAVSAVWPGALCAGWPPAWTGVSVPAGAGEPALAAGAVATAVRSPVEMRVNLMPVPCAAASSCTSRLGMSTFAGMALPRRTICV